MTALVRLALPRLFRILPFLAAGIGYAASAVALTWPLALRLGTAVPHDIGDPLSSIWILWWNAHHVPFTVDWWNGFAFYPTSGTLALSEHRVGLGLFASPVQWLGGSPVLAYNVTLLLTFVLSALAAHALAFTVTGLHSASLLAGLAFGFAPYRIAHISHVEVLSSYWMPIQLLALHRYVTTDRAVWVALFAAACWLQALACGYYLFYFSVILLLWMFWFIRPMDWRRLCIIGVAWLLAGLAVLPVLLKYRAIQGGLGLFRGIDEIEYFSADITSVFKASHLLALWRMLPPSSNGTEGELFPGVVILALTLAGILLSIRRPSVLNPPRRFRQAMFGCAGLMLVVAASAVIVGPWRVQWDAITLLSVGKPEKPVSLAFLCLTLALLTGPRFLTAVRARSIFAFYVTAGIVAWVLSWGPAPRFLNHLVLYKAPYAWLMALPGFHSGLRVPGRFGMVMTLMLAVAGALGAVRLLQRVSRPTRRLALATLAIGIAADGWVVGMPLADVPAFWTPPANIAWRDVSAVLELPLGDPHDDATAQYRSIGHGRPVVNGLSGYVPPHYPVLNLALEQEDPQALSALTDYGSLLIAVNRASDPDSKWTSYVSRSTPPVGSTSDHIFFLLPHNNARSGFPGFGSKLEIRGVAANTGRLDVQDVLDGDHRTRWSSGAPQTGKEQVRIDLASIRCLGALRLSLGPYVGDFPRDLAVDVSTDENWRVAWRGLTAGLVTRAALIDPLNPILTISLGRVHARAIRLRQLGQDKVLPWSIADVNVTACAR